MPIIKFKFGSECELENPFLAFDPSKVVSVYKDEIETLKHQNDELAKALGKTTVERDWAVGKLKSLDLLNSKNLVESKLISLSKARQCVLLSINRLSTYYKFRADHSSNIQIIRKIDDVYKEYPEYGYRYRYNQLLDQDNSVGKDRVLRYMVF